MEVLVLMMAKHGQLESDELVELTRGITTSYVDNDSIPYR
jgi:predicted transcriptional regulator